MTELQPIRAASLHTAAIQIANQFLGMLDYHGGRPWRRYLRRQSHIKKWMISADFCINDSRRPQDCLAFSVIPYDAEFPDLIADASSGLLRDLKRTKELTASEIGWLRDKRRFHFAFALPKARPVFPTPDASPALAVGMIDDWLHRFSVLPIPYDGSKSIKLRRELEGRTKPKKLLGDVRLHAAHLPEISASPA